ncbi:MAG: hypothetical protein ABF316_13765 [Marivita sp.]|jgi:hypothetical protein
MADILEMRRHRFDALHGFLTGAKPVLPQRRRQSGRCEVMLCISILMTAVTAVVGLNAL